MKALILAASLLAAPLYAGGETTNPLIIKNDSGGFINQYARKIAAHTGPVRIIGTCQSACTMWLAKACVTPKARLMFHAPRHALKGNRVRVQDHVAGVALIARHYPPRLERWYRREFIKPGNTRKIWMGYPALIAHGARPCGKD
ncbi:hypothetical protein [Vannielia litorea]|uniref:hypothetical protein n=1 Tax=Vannielia litorea TaxID=1217970 RepID=UPI001BCEFB8B|nr:hypothetical protein [Vannielia litorea]MBS8228169.1 hypothetical protein [Vannielia litorea]